jgi:hypothetical protein
MQRGRLAFHNILSEDNNLNTLQIRVYFGKKYHFTIKDLFNWSVETGWNMFWDTGKKHYHEEMVFYELLTQLDNQHEATHTVGIVNG